jgi:predicted nucleic acid-binding protein
LSLFVDTSVWSLALRRDRTSEAPEIDALRRALEGEDIVLTTGLVLQELLQGFAGPRARAQILDRFSALPLVVPDRQDHVDAAELRNRCRRAGVQIGTIDALLAQLCVRHDLTMLSTDGDFRRVAAHSPLKLWKSAT